MLGITCCCLLWESSQAQKWLEYFFLENGKNWIFAVLEIEIFAERHARVFGLTRVSGCEHDQDHSLTFCRQSGAKNFGFHKNSSGTAGRKRFESFYLFATSFTGQKKNCAWRNATQKCGVIHVAGCNLKATRGFHNNFRSISRHNFCWFPAW